MILPNTSQSTYDHAKSDTLPNDSQLPSTNQCIDSNPNLTPNLSTGVDKEGGWRCCCCHFGGSQKKRVMRNELKEREQRRAREWMERQGRLDSTQGTVDLELGLSSTAGPSASECQKKESVIDPQRNRDGKGLNKGADVNLEDVGHSSIPSDPPPRYE